MRLYRKEELAVMAGVTERTITNEITRGNLIPTRFGRATRITEDQLQAWLRRSRA